MNGPLFEVGQAVTPIHSEGYFKNIYGEIFTVAEVRWHGDPDAGWYIKLKEKPTFTLPNGYTDICWWGQEGFAPVLSDDALETLMQEVDQAVPMLDRRGIY